MFESSLSMAICYLLYFRPSCLSRPLAWLSPSGAGRPARRSTRIITSAGRDSRRTLIPSGNQERSKFPTELCIFSTLKCLVKYKYVKLNNFQIRLTYYFVSCTIDSKKYHYDMDKFNLIMS